MIDVSKLKSGDRVTITQTFIVGRPDPSDNTFSYRASEDSSYDDWFSIDDPNVIDVKVERKNDWVDVTSAVTKEG